MEEILHSYISQKDLEKFEKNYNKELGENILQPTTQFEYAWGLIRSFYTSDIEKGIKLLEELVERNSDRLRDYIYYLAVGYARLKQYFMALNFCQEFLKIEPNNRQVCTLQECIKEKLKDKTINGIAKVGKATLIIGGIVGVAAVLFKGLSLLTSESSGPSCNEEEED
ncbi:mitochondrial fission 1 protein-like [Condylostylus longicornis]|uniref:mitochondrial fission 1 protein-like n=1 Tax=Condylostylus longicornis TaxID=2530218 RepID=UPI00244E2416|nr:mitochondrial fission 1 protein-like [Condylostylus longicornis]